MVVNETRKRLLRQLNSRYIYGRYVCVHYRKSYNYGDGLDWGN